MNILIFIDLNFKSAMLLHRRWNDHFKQNFVNTKNDTGPTPKDLGPSSKDIAHRSVLLASMMEGSMEKKCAHNCSVSRGGFSIQ